MNFDNFKYLWQKIVPMYSIFKFFDQAKNYLSTII